MIVMALVLVVVNMIVDLALEYPMDNDQQMKSQINLVEAL